LLNRRTRPDMVAGYNARLPHRLPRPAHDLCAVHTRPRISAPDLHLVILARPLRLIPRPETWRQLSWLVREAAGPHSTAWLPRFNGRDSNHGLLCWRVCAKYVPLRVGRNLPHRLPQAMTSVGDVRSDGAQPCAFSAMPLPVDDDIGPALFQFRSSSEPGLP